MKRSLQEVLLMADLFKAVLEVNQDFMSRPNGGLNPLHAKLNRVVGVSENCIHFKLVKFQGWYASRVQALVEC